MIRHLLFVPVFFVCAAASAWAQSAPANAASAAIGRTTAATAEYTIGPEDVLDISVWKNPELSRKVPVRPDGRVSLPLINDIQAAGLTPSELREQLAKRLAEFVPSAEVSVIVSEVQSLKVAVVGAVTTPGRIMIKSPATVVDFIAPPQLTDYSAPGGLVVLLQHDSNTTRITP